MPTVRTTKTKSGARAVQVVRYEQRKVVVLKHLGSAHDRAEEAVLRQSAREWIEKEWPQQSLLPSKPNRLLHLDHAKFVGIRYTFAYTLLQQMMKVCGLADLNRQLLLDLVLIRLFEPCSKLHSLVLLKRYFDISYSQPTLYRTLPTFIALKESVADLATSFAKQHLNENLAFVLYDVTTLYFESFTADELRKPGFSKDNKSNQPQILVGLLVTTTGFPLGYEIFAGNTFEGHTMIPVLKAFQKTHGNENLTVVADAGMLSTATIAELVKEKLSYIVGARVANLPTVVIDQLSTDLGKIDGKTQRLLTKQGYLIGEFSLKRWRKDTHEMEKQIARAKELVRKQEPGKRSKFVTVTKEKEKYILNDTVVEKTKKLLGIKGYYTNLPPTILSDVEIIARYHDLWHVEQSFRMAKSDLVTRPIFHYKKEAVQAHLLICFMALVVGKYMEITTEISLRRILEILKSVTDAIIVDSLTGQTAVLRSELTEEATELVRALNCHTK